jgi:hypothetical protein
MKSHDILIVDMNKRILRTLYPVFMVLTGIILALISAFVSSASVSAVSESDHRFNPNIAAAAIYQATTPTPVSSAVSRAGSTDGILAMGVVIVIIVLVPILIRRSLWIHDSPRI